MRGCTTCGFALLTLFLATCGLHSGAQTVSEPVRAHFVQGQNALAQGRLDEAEREFSEVLRLDPKRAEAHANLGGIAYRQGRYERAIQSFTEALRLNPSLGDAQALLGLAQIRSGHAEEGRQSLQKSWAHIRDKELRINAGTELIRFDQQGNQWEAAANIAHDLAANNPQDPRVLYLSYRIYSELAAHAVAALTRNAPDSAQMHRILAEAAGMQNDVAGAVAEYRKALEVDPSLPGIHDELGEAILASSQDESARKLAKQEFETGLVANPSDADAEFGLGEVYFREGNLESAAQHFGRALQLRPEFADAHLELAKTLSSLGKETEALAHLKEAERLDPNSEAAHYRLAQAYRSAGENERAAQEVEIVKKLRQSTSQHSGFQKRTHLNSPMRFRNKRQWVDPPLRSGFC